jgi:hypothetical protein
MPLTTCPDCERLVSDQAPACPRCGRPQPVALVTIDPSTDRSTRSKSILSRPFSVLAIIAIGLFFFIKIRQATSELEDSIAGVSRPVEKSDDDRLREAAIAEKRVLVGMTQEQVRASWGQPEHVNTTTYGAHVDEQWVFSSSAYVYFEDGVVTSFQQSH